MQSTKEKASFLTDCSLRFRNIFIQNRIHIQDYK